MELLVKRHHEVEEVHRVEVELIAEADVRAQGGCIRFRRDLTEDTKDLSPRVVFR